MDILEPDPYENSDVGDILAPDAKPDPVFGKYGEIPKSDADTLSVPDTVAYLLKNSQKNSLLTAEEEIALSLAAKAGDTEARDRMVASNIRLVFSIARKFQYRGLELSDLIQEGNVWLIKAIEKFNPELGYRFSTYATSCIRQTILYSIGVTGMEIRHPAKMVAELRRYSAFVAAYEMENGKTPTEREIREQFDIDSERVRKLKELYQMRYLSSLDHALGHDDEDTNLYDLVPAPSEYEPYEQALRKSVSEKIRAVFDVNPEGLAALTRREKAVISMRFWLFGTTGEHSLEEIGWIMNLSTPRIRQIEKMGLYKLRKYMARVGIAPESCIQ